MRAIIGRPRAGVPFRRAGRYFVTRNDGTQNQDVLYVADSLAELLAGGRVLVDPNTLLRRRHQRADQPSPSARTAGYAAYGRQRGRQRLGDLPPARPGHRATGRRCRRSSTKFSAAEWLPDGQSYVYIHFDHEGRRRRAPRRRRWPARACGCTGSATTRTRRRADPGVPRERPADLLAGGHRRRPLRGGRASSRAPRTATGSGSTRSLDEHGRSRLGEPIKIIDEAVAEFALVPDRRRRRSYLRTDLDAERGRLVERRSRALSAGADRPTWQRGARRVRATRWSTRSARGDGFVAVYLVDAQPEVRRFDPDGADLGRVSMSPAARWSGWTASRADPECFVGLSSVTSPTQSYRVDAGDRGGHAAAGPGARSAEARSCRRRSGSSGAGPTSADGTEVPYFLISPADADLSQPAADAAVGLRRLQDPDLRRLPTRLVRLARGRRAAGDRQPARRRRVRHRVVRGRAAGAQAERLRRLHRRRRAPECDRGDHVRRSWRCTVAATAGCWSAR